VSVPFSAVIGRHAIINLLDGNDSISVSSAQIPTTVDGGNGTDTITTSGGAAPH
jgi:hypothetical protein